MVTPTLMSAPDEATLFPAEVSSERFWFLNPKCSELDIKSTIKLLLSVGCPLGQFESITGGVTLYKSTIFTENEVSELIFIRDFIFLCELCFPNHKIASQSISFLTDLNKIRGTAELMARVVLSVACRLLGSAFVRVPNVATTMKRHSIAVVDLIF